MAEDPDSRFLTNPAKRDKQNGINKKCQRSLQDK
jgi:hypothetical protein